jgi:hypothetical protein
MSCAAHINRSAGELAWQSDVHRCLQQRRNELHIASVFRPQTSKGCQHQGACEVYEAAADAGCLVGVAE